MTVEYLILDWIEENGFKEEKLCVLCAHKRSEECISCSEYSHYQRQQPQQQLTICGKCYGEGFIQTANGYRLCDCVIGIHPPCDICVYGRR